MSLFRTEIQPNGASLTIPQRAFRNAADERLVLDDVEGLEVPEGFVEFDPAVDLDLEPFQQAQLSAINQAYEDEFAALKAQYPDAERESWPIQLREADMLAADSAASTPYLDALLLARGFDETKAELAGKIQAKNATYSVLSAALTGKRHRLERQVLAASTVDEVLAVTWEVP